MLLHHSPDHIRQRLKRKVDGECCEILKKKMQDGDELWWYDDADAPYYSGMGYAIVRNGEVVDREPIGYWWI